MLQELLKLPELPLEVAEAVAPEVVLVESLQLAEAAEEENLLIKGARVLLAIMERKQQESISLAAVK